MTPDGMFRTEETFTTYAPIAYTAESVLTIKQVAEWLQVSTRMVERLQIPPVYLGDRTRRYLGSSVLDYLRKKGNAA